MKNNPYIEPVYVLLSHTGSLLANAIKTVTKNPYSHSSISFDTNLNTMYSFGRRFKNNPLIGTFVKEDIQKGFFEKIQDIATYSLYVTFVTPSEKKLMEQKLKYFIDNKKPYRYNFTGLIRHQFGMETERENAYFCSEFVSTIIGSGKQMFDIHPSLIKPYDFAKHKDFIFVTRGMLKHYNPEKVNKIVADMIQ